MSTTSLKKISFSRRRFVYTDSFSDFKDWEKYYFKLKDELEKNSQFQLLAPDVFIEVDELGPKFRVLIMVLGKPIPGFSYFDQEAGEFFEFSSHLGDYLEKKSALFEKARAIKSALSQKVGQVYYIVLDEEKLSLHFFK